jgi:vanillin dehydrogenase
MNYLNVYINGEWIATKSTFNSMNPSTGEVFAEVADADMSVTKKAIEAAKNASKKWAGTPHFVRAKMLNKVADIIERRIPDIVNMLMDETGAWIGIAKFQAAGNPDFWRAGAALAYQVNGEILPSDFGKVSLVTREPLGVVTVITPWNVPLLLAARTCGGILAVGNTVVLKPSEESPVSGGLFLAEVFEEAGVPPGVFNVITCSRENVVEVGDEIVVNPAVKAVCFTGSALIGKMIGAKCGQHLKKSSLELGGKDALIVMDDADMNKAVESATFGAFMHQGQICMGTRRVFVDKKVVDEFRTRFIKNVNSLGSGDVRAMNKPIGPLINQKQLEKMIAQVEDAKSKGATILTGGNHKDLFFEPTVIEGVTKNMDVFEKETFGPITTLSTYETIEEALEKVNEIDSGLSAAIITQNEEKGLELARKIESGMCHINCNTINDEPHAPFGGAKNSGLGRYGGKATIEAFTTTRWLTIEKGGRAFPPPFKEKP